MNYRRTRAGRVLGLYRGKGLEFIGYTVRKSLVLLSEGISKGIIPRHV